MRKNRLLCGLILISCPGALHAGEAEIHLPPLQTVSFFGERLSGMAVLYGGIAVCIIGALFGVFQYRQTRALPSHRSMREVSRLIWETCKTYMWQQGKFLALLWGLIAVCIV